MYNVFDFMRGFFCLFFGRSQSVFEYFIANAHFSFYIYISDFISDFVATLHFFFTYGSPFLSSYKNLALLNHNYDIKSQNYMRSNYTKRSKLKHKKT